jgi:hypothetical protein
MLIARSATSKLCELLVHSAALAQKSNRVAVQINQKLRLPKFHAFMQRRGKGGASRVCIVAIE